MTISFTCPHCGVASEVGDQYAGQTGPCKSCGQTVTIPGSFAAQAPPAKSKAGGGGGGTAAVVAIVGAVLLVGLLGCGGVVLALVLPAVQAAREAARRTQCMGHVKQIMIAMHNYHDTWGELPPATVNDANGRPMHSWRVALLPYLEQSALYERYDYDQPWDSPANQRVADQILDVYNCPSDAGGPSTATNYMLITGPNTAFRQMPNFDGLEGASFAQFLDGTSNTAVLVEVPSTGHPWAKPGDLTAAEFKSLMSSQQSLHPGGFNVGFADGSVHFIPFGTSPQTLDNLFDLRDGNAVDIR